MATTAAKTAAQEKDLETPAAESIKSAETSQETDSKSTPTSTEKAQATPNPPAAKRPKPKQKKPRERASRANVPVKLSLHSNHAQKVFEYNFGTAANALYVMSVILPIYVDAQGVNGIGEVIDKEFDGVREELTADIERATQVAEENGIDLSAVEYTKPKEYTAELTTPRAGQYLGLIREMDRFISMTDVLWLSGIYNDHQHQTGSYKWRRQLIKLANRMRNTSSRAMNLARRTDGQSGALAELFVDSGENDSQDTGAADVADTQDDTADDGADS